MTRDEVKKVLMVIQAAYPNYNPQDKTVAINIWYSMTKQFDYETAQMALKTFIATDTSGFAPSIGQFIECAYNVQAPNGLNELEAWGLVREAIKDGYYNASKGFDSLPDDVKEAVGGAGQIHAWSQCTTDHVVSSVQNAFIKSYRSVLAKKKKMEKLPIDVRKSIESSKYAEIEKKAVV